MFVFAACRQPVFRLPAEVNPILPMATHNAGLNVKEFPGHPSVFQFNIRGTLVLKQLKEEKARKCRFQAFLFDTAEVCFLFRGSPFCRDAFQLFMN